MSLSCNYILARQELYSRSVPSIKESKQVVLFTSVWQGETSTILRWENLKLGLRNAEIRKEEVLKGKIAFKTILKFVTKSFEHTQLTVRTVEVKDSFMLILFVEVEKD